MQTVYLLAYPDDEGCQSGRDAKILLGIPERSAAALSLSS